MSPVRIRLNHSSSVSYLPEEIVIDILVQLPVKSLIRFMSVSKPWLHFISNPQFLKSHLDRSLLENPKLLATADPNGRHPSASPVDFEFLEIPPLFDQCIVISSCNGIVLTNYRDRIFLWNPSTKQCKRVFTPKATVRFCYYPMNSISFGYDSISNDYKVLMFSCHKDSVDSNYELLVGVYSTNSDSWRDILVPLHIRLPHYPFYPRINCGPVIDGLFYFKATNGIASFHLHNELFELIPFPSNKRAERSNILDFQGSVAVIFKSVSDGTISLWTLDDVSGEMSWTKKVSFAPQMETNRVFLYAGAGKFYGRSENDCTQLIFYDSEKNETNSVPGRILSVFKHTETLVSIKGFEPVDKFIV